ncbi:MAG TPA: hypothetical protein V6C85_16135 [Allocoleopsis sp.]
MPENQSEVDNIDADAIALTSKFVSSGTAESSSASRVFTPWGDDSNPSKTGF